MSTAVEDAGREFAAVIARKAAGDVKGRMQATVADLLGQALAISDAAADGAVTRAAKAKAMARAEGIRDAAQQMKQTLRGIRS